MAGEISGIKQTLAKFDALDAATSVKVLRRAVARAVKPVAELMKQRVPKGTKAHKTYKGYTVYPGFASRSIRAITKVDKKTGQAVARLGVRKEAYYAIQFYDLGPYTITKRRQSAGKGKRRTIAVKAYTLRPRPWFRSTFSSNASRMVATIGDELKTGIDKVAKSRG